MSRMEDRAISDRTSRRQAHAFGCKNRVFPVTTPPLMRLLTPDRDHVEVVTLSTIFLIKDINHVCINTAIFVVYYCCSIGEFLLSCETTPTTNQGRSQPPNQMKSRLAPSRGTGQT